MPSQLNTCLARYRRLLTTRCFIKTSNKLAHQHFTPDFMYKHKACDSAQGVLRVRRRIKRLQVDIDVPNGNVSEW